MKGFKKSIVLSFLLLAAGQLFSQQLEKIVHSRADGIQPDPLVMRRDPSDIIKVNDLYYVWYACSRDGKTWEEKGRCIAKGNAGTWDEQSAFTPNILVFGKKYYLFYSGVPRPFNNVGNRVTKSAIGVAVSDSPDGPWRKAKDPVHFAGLEGVPAVPAAAGFYRPEAFTDNGKGGMPAWGIEIAGAKDFLPGLGRFDLRWEEPSGGTGAAVFADSVLNRLTIGEKLSLLAGMGTARSEFGDKGVPYFGIKGIPGKGIPDLIMGHGITGVRTGRDMNTHATYFCSPMAMGCSWNVDLYERVGEAMAVEMRGLGQDLSLGPTLNIIRNPLGGRSWECISEDSFLIARFIVPYVRAMQRNGIICGPKHFAANNQEGNRFDINNEVDERTLREIYLPAFKAAVREGGALNIMASYNRLNGVFMCQNKYLLDDVLRGEWGFDGFVLSDFSFGLHSTLAGVYSGLDVEMPGPQFYGERLLAELKSGTLSERQIDGMLGNVIRVMHKEGLFSRPRVEHAASVHDGEHQALAGEVAREAPVLLKNEQGALPLDLKKIRSVAVVGPNAKRWPSLPVTDENYANYMQGGGSGRCYYFPGSMATPYNSLKAALGSKTALGSDIKVSYSLGCRTADLNARGDTLTVIEKSDDELIAEAVKAAKGADVAVVVAGLSGFDESEGWDRRSAMLPGKQNELIRQVAAVNRHTIVVLVAGSYVDVSLWISDVRALLFVPYCGEKIGDGIADILMGKVSPSGKLSISWPRSVNDYPSRSIYRGEPYSKGGVSNVYTEGIYVGYRWFQKKKIPVRYPFGFGLSYSRFEYGDMKVDATEWPVKVAVRIRNSGGMAASEVLQLYVGQEHCSVDRPPLELKGFQKIRLAPGESREVNFQLGKDAFAFYDVTKRRWKIEAGSFKIFAGTSSASLDQGKSIVLDEMYL